ncbi:MAG: hypothetical protein C4K58_06030 [Flavobacteriaceae bacterium]|nr:MAG: hypothetical protein C4K58_06030 [Flavobacteriaceae bacterium]
MKSSNYFAIISSGTILFYYFSERLNYWQLLGLACLASILYIIWEIVETSIIRRKKCKTLEVELSSIEGFKATEKILFHFGFIALDQNSKQIAVKNKPSSKIQIYPFQAITDCEIQKNLVTEQKTEGIFGKVILGGVIGILFGVAGIITGVIMGILLSIILSETVTIYRISTLKLVIRLKDSTSQRIDFSFFDAQSETLNTQKAVKESDFAYKHKIKGAMEKLFVWKGYIDEIIFENNE